MASPRIDNFITPVVYNEKGQGYDPQQIGIQNLFTIHEQDELEGIGS